jgi:hypothetical protein
MHNLSLSEALRRWHLRSSGRCSLWLVRSRRTWVNCALKPRADINLRFWYVPGDSLPRSVNWRRNRARISRLPTDLGRQQPEASRLPVAKSTSRPQVHGRLPQVRSEPNRDSLVHDPLRHWLAHNDHRKGQHRLKLPIRVESFIAPQSWPNTNSVQMFHGHNPHQDCLSNQLDPIHAREASNRFTYWTTRREAIVDSANWAGHEATTIDWAEYFRT